MQAAGQGGRSRTESHWCWLLEADEELVLVENLTHTSKPSLRSRASSHWSSYTLGQLQSQNACGHESH